MKLTVLWNVATGILCNRKYENGAGRSSVPFFSIKKHGKGVKYHTFATQINRECHTCSLY